MTLEELSEEEIKDIMKKLLFKVEADKDVVEKSLIYRQVYKYKETYCINFYNGYEHKVCCIDNHKADISSESMDDNLELTKYYKQLLNEIFESKAQLEVL